MSSRYRSRGASQDQCKRAETTQTRYVIRFKDEKSMATAKNNTEWLGKLSNETEFVKLRFGVVVFCFPTTGITLPETRRDAIIKIMEINEMQNRNNDSDDIVWFERTDKPMGLYASTKTWLDTAKAAGRVVANGLLYG